MVLSDRINLLQEECFENERKQSEFLENLSIEINKLEDEKKETLNALIGNINEDVLK